MKNYIELMKTNTSFYEGGTPWSRKNYIELEQNNATIHFQKRSDGLYDCMDYWYINECLTIVISFCYDKSKNEVVGKIKNSYFPYDENLEKVFNRYGYLAYKKNLLNEIQEEILIRKFNNENLHKL